MKKVVNYAIDFIVRYAILIVAGLLSNTIFYMIFTSLTVNAVYFLLGLFYDASLLSNIILVNKIPIEIIGSCVAGSAYFLLLILNLSTRDIKVTKRLMVLTFSFASLLFINVLRIFILSIMFISQEPFFDITHQLFWYLGSTVFVIGIWFLSVKIFKIKGIPFYTDIKFILKNSSKSNNSKSSKKH